MTSSPWPESISSGLILPCGDCERASLFDYRVTDEFWARHVGADKRLGVICLPCLDARCKGEGLAHALLEIQWTGTGHTVRLEPTFQHIYSNS